MRRGFVSIVVVLMGLVLLFAVLWFYGYHSDATSTINSVEKIKRTHQEVLSIIAKRFPKYIHTCKDRFTQENERKECMKNLIRHQITNYLQNNLQR